MKQIALDLAREILADPEALRQDSTARGTSPEALDHQEHMAMLRELTRMGMDLARLLHGQAMATTAPTAEETPSEEAARQPAVPGPAAAAAALAFSRIAKTVRQCMALQARFGDDHRRRGGAEVALVGQVITESRAALQAEKRRQVKRAIVETIEAEAAAEVIRRSEAESLLSDLNDRLDDELALDDLEERPLGACIAKLCKQLGVAPDWSSWRDTVWAAAEIAEKPAGSPYAGEDWKNPVERKPRPRDTNPYMQPGPHRRW